MKQGDSKKGFTIIEVVLVLAVAGLIFIMVFVALPALQRAQRDNARRDDMMKFISEVKKYQTSNRGALPGVGQVTQANPIVKVQPNNAGEISGNPASSTWAGFYRDYLGKNFIDPDGEYYKLIVMNCNANTDVVCTGSGDYVSNMPTEPFGQGGSDYNILVVLQAKCSGTITVGSSNPRNLAVLYRLEGSGSYCFNT